MGMLYIMLLTESTYYEVLDKLTESFCIAFQWFFFKIIKLSGYIFALVQKIHGKNEHLFKLRKISFNANYNLV